MQIHPFTILPTRDETISSLVDEVQSLKNQQRLEEFVQKDLDGKADTIHYANMIEAVETIQDLHTALEKERKTFEHLEQDFTRKIQDANDTISLLESGLLSMQSALENEKFTHIAAEVSKIFLFKFLD